MNIDIHKIWRNTIFELSVMPFDLYNVDKIIRAVWIVKTIKIL